MGGGKVGEGTSGCTNFVLSGVPTEYHTGQDFAIFLIDPDRIPEGHGLTGIWPVTRGIVRAPVEGEMTIDELEERVEAVGYEPFPDLP